MARQNPVQVLPSSGGVPVSLGAVKRRTFSEDYEWTFVSSAPQSDRRLTRSATNEGQHVPMRPTSATEAMSLLADDKRKSCPP